MHTEHNHSHSGNINSKDELVALVEYMVKHNASHTSELSTLAHQLENMGNSQAYNDVMAAIAEYEKGNMHLSNALEKIV